MSDQTRFVVKVEGLAQRFYFNSTSKQTGAESCHPPFHSENLPTEFDRYEKAAEKARLAGLDGFEVVPVAVERKRSRLDEINL